MSQYFNVLFGLEKTCFCFKKYSARFIFWTILDIIVLRYSLGFQKINQRLHFFFFFYNWAQVLGMSFILISLIKNSQKYLFFQSNFLLLEEIIKNKKEFTEVHRQAKNSLKFLKTRIALQALMYIIFTIVIQIEMKTCHNSVLPMHLIFYNKHTIVMSYYLIYRFVHFLCHLKLLKAQNPKTVFKLIVLLYIIIQLMVFSSNMKRACKRMRTDTFDNYYDGFTDNGPLPKFYPSQFKRGMEYVNYDDIACKLKADELILCFHYYIAEMEHDRVYNT